MNALRNIENPVVKVDFAPKKGKMSKVSKIVLSHDEESARRLVGKKFLEFRIDSSQNVVFVTDEDGQSQKLKLNHPTVLRNKNGEYKLRLCEDLNAEMKKRAFHQFVVWSVVLHIFFAVAYVISPDFNKPVAKKEEVVDKDRIAKIIEKIKAKKKKPEPKKVVAKKKPEPKAKPKKKPPKKKKIAKKKPKPKKKVVAKKKPKPKPKKKIVPKKKKFVAKKNTKNKKIDLAKKKKARLLAQQRAKQQAAKKKAAVAAKKRAQKVAKAKAIANAKAAAAAKVRAQKIAKAKAIANAKAAANAKKLAAKRAKVAAAKRAKAAAKAKAVAVARAKAKAAAEAKARAVAVARAKAKAAKEAKARAVAAKKAKLAKSLNFLSSGPGKFQLADGNYDQKAKTYRSAASMGGGKGSALTAGAAGGKKGNYLASIAKTRGTPSGPINTNGSRGMGTGSMYGAAGSGGEGKALNGVEGKVTLAALYTDGPGGGTDMSGAFGDGAGGIEVSGMGSVDQSALEKALARRLEKFQYCYEKALLSDASLSGNIMMGWSINTSGKAWKIKVVKSQMNNNKLHGCITKEIRGIPFPRPKGGELYVKFPFNFSSSTL
jgi:hypothetical protein